MENEKSWSFSGIWNSALVSGEERKVEPRDYLYASELGKAPIDVFLSMKGVAKTNPPNDRSKRKFEAGNLWEWIVKMLLTRAGVLQNSQKPSPYQYPELLRVSGRLDFIAGGKIDAEKAKRVVEEEKLGLPPSFYRAYDQIVEYFAKNYPDGLEPRILEIKSVSAFVFDGLEAKKNASIKIHRLQLYHYLKAENMKRGDIVYICRDDCRMMEVPVLMPSPVEDEYKDYIAKMTEWVKKDEQPPLEQPIIFDEDTGKFSKNNGIAWSGYLTMLYGLKDQNEFDEKFKPQAERFNRVIGRIKRGDKMTVKNEEVKREIVEAGFDLPAIITKFAGSEEESDGTLN